MIEDKIQTIIQKSSIICSVYSNSLKKFIEKYRYTPNIESKNKFLFSQEILDTLNEIHWLNWSYEQLYKDYFWEEKIFEIYKKLQINEKFNLDYIEFICISFHKYIKAIENKLNNGDKKSFLIIYADEFELSGEHIKNYFTYFNSFDDFYFWLKNRYSNVGDTFLDVFFKTKKTRTIKESLSISIDETYSKSISKIFPKMKFNLYVALLSKWTYDYGKFIPKENEFTNKYQTYTNSEKYTVNNQNINNLNGNKNVETKLNVNVTTKPIPLSEGQTKKGGKSEPSNKSKSDFEWGEFTLGFLFISIVIPPLFPLFVLYIFIAIVFDLLSS